jgi:class 3 adenylate cyclase
VTERDEAALVLRAWRAEQLSRLGFPRLVAVLFADAVDWRDAATLIARGCSHSLALEILR